MTASAPGKPGCSVCGDRGQKPAAAAGVAGIRSAGRICSPDSREIRGLGPGPQRGPGAEPLGRTALQFLGPVLYLLALASVAPALAGPTNGGFESGDFTGWTADPNWVVVDNSCGYYSGWAGKYWAWSGGKGEPAMGNLKSQPFVLDKPAVRMLISGWASIRGTGQPRHWNYVTLNLEDGTEVDRVYAPDTTVFVPVYLDGSKVRGKRVYIQAVDDADQPTFSMLCIDDVHTADLPAEFARPVTAPAAFDPARSIRLEDERYLVEVSRTNGAITRLRDKVGGLELILEARLANNFTFALPIIGKEPWQTLEANWIRGREQRLTSFKLEGNRLTLDWNGPLRNYLGEEFRASARMTIELAEGGVRFALHIGNRTACPVGEVYFPILGGIQGLGKTVGQLKATQLVRPAGEAARKRRAAGPEPPADAISCVTADIFHVFANMAPFGDQGPEQFFAYPDAQPEPWVGFTAPRLQRSVLIGVRDTRDRPLVARLMLDPANSGTTRDDGNWPRPEELKGLPVGVEVSFVDIATHAPGRDYTAAPVFLQALASEAAGFHKAFAAWPAAE